MEEINDIIIKVIIETIQTYYKQLDNDVTLNDPLEYHLALSLFMIETFMAHANYVGHDKINRENLSISLVEGKIIEKDCVFDSRCWIEVNGFVIDLTYDKSNRARLDFDKGIAEKLKQDFDSHFAVNVMAVPEFQNLIHVPYKFANGEVKSLLTYVKETLA